MKRFFPFLGILILTACAPNETLVKYGGADHVWRLVELDGNPVNFPNEIQFGPPNNVLGKGPCSTFSAKQGAPYPWFELEGINAQPSETCTWMAQEDRLFSALQDMQIVEISGPNMVLSNDAGREMVFVGITDGG